MAVQRFFGVKADTVAGGSRVHLAAPTGVVLTPSGSGGSLATGTYYVRVTATNAAGESVGSAESSTPVTGPTGSISVAYVLPAGATGAKVYVGTAAGAEGQWFADTATPFVITTATGTAGTVPARSTARIVIPDADDIWPVEGATVDRNVTHLTRENEITGFRGVPQPESFRKDPRVTINGLGYPRLLEKLLWHCLGTPDDVDDPGGGAAVTHAVTPIGYGGSGILPALYAHVIRDAQVDKISGCYVNSVTVTFTLDGHATFEAELFGLYHVSGSGSVPVLTRNVRDVATFKLRDLLLYFGSSPISVPGVTSYSFTFTNNIVDDSEARFAAGQMVDRIADSAGVVQSVWYPYQHFMGGSQSVSGEIAFNSPAQARDFEHDVAFAQQMVAEVEGRVLATTPATRELMRFTTLNSVWTDGGAEALAKEGLQTSSYTYGGFIDADGDDVIVESVNDQSAAITT